MKINNGMRPHDIAILLKISTYKDNSWFAKDIANSLKISASEVSESLTRSVIAGLIGSDKKTIMRSALLEFLEYGLKYVYPAVPGSIVRGVPTAYSAKPLSEIIQAGDFYVWPHAKGFERGQSITPLHPNLPEVCLNDQKLYELLTLIDSLRIGRTREKKYAMNELKRRILK